MLPAKPNITYPAQIATLSKLEKSQEVYYNRFTVLCTHMSYTCIYTDIATYPNINRHYTYMVIATILWELYVLVITMELNQSL